QKPRKNSSLQAKSAHGRIRRRALQNAPIERRVQRKSPVELADDPESGILHLGTELAPAIVAHVTDATFKVAHTSLDGADEAPTTRHPPNVLEGRAIVFNVLQNVAADDQVKLPDQMSRR